MVQIVKLQKKEAESKIDILRFSLVARGGVNGGGSEKPEITPGAEENVEEDVDCEEEDEEDGEDNLLLPGLLQLLNLLDSTSVLVGGLFARVETAEPSDESREWRTLCRRSVGV